MKVKVTQTLNQRKHKAISIVLLFKFCDFLKGKKSRALKTVYILNEIIFLRNLNVKEISNSLNIFPICQL